MPANFARKVPAPLPSDINTLCNPARVSTMRAILGSPRTPLGQDCDDAKASQRVRELLVARNVGPFQVRGLRPFVELLRRVLDRVREGDPELYAAVGSAGVLCVRNVRGSTTQPSNHSWGTAIDFKFFDPAKGEHVLDLPLGDGRVQVGCLEIYKHFKADALATGEWCFWGAGFAREDGMHFEASDELIRVWRGQGRI